MIIHYHEKVTQGSGGGISVTKCDHFRNRFVGTLTSTICLHLRKKDKKKKTVDCGFDEGYIYRLA